MKRTVSASLQSHDRVLFSYLTELDKKFVISDKEFTLILIQMTYLLCRLSYNSYKINKNTREMLIYVTSVKRHPPSTFSHSNQPRISNLPFSFLLEKISYLRGKVQIFTILAHAIIADYSLFAITG